MNILITRPSPSGEQLVESLRAQGKHAWHLPLIKFYPGKDLDHLSCFLSDLIVGNLIFIVSKQAIDYAHIWLMKNGISWPSDIHYFAIGRTTGQRIQSLCGLKKVYYPNNGDTSEDLLSLPALSHIKGKRALILRGNGGRELLYHTLQQRGVYTTYCECYRRCQIDYDGEEQAYKMQSVGVDRLVITSCEMLQQFYILIPKRYRFTWLYRCQLIVISNRIAILARQLGWTDIIVADAADNDSLVRLLLI